MIYKQQKDTIWYHFTSSQANMKVSISTILFVVACVGYGLAVPTALQPQKEAKKLSLRRMLVHCLDIQADEATTTDDSRFTSCLAGQLSESGDVKLLPGVVLSSEKAEDTAMEPTGGRAMSTGRSIKLSLPWSGATARWLGGWGNPSLVLTGDTSSLDVAVELKKDEPEDEGRGKKLKKLLLPLLIGLKMKSALIGLLSYGAVAALAGKALFISVASLVVSALIGMRKMYQHHVETSHHPVQYSSSYEPSYYHHHRSYEPAAATDIGAEASMQHGTQVNSYVVPASTTVDHMAYKAYAPEG